MSLDLDDEERVTANDLMGFQWQIACGMVTVVRSSHRRCSVEKGVLKSFTIFTAKHLLWSLLFNKVAGLRPATLLKRRLEHRCFPEIIAKFLRKSVLKNIYERLRLCCVTPQKFRLVYHSTYVSVQWSFLRKLW